MLFKFSLVLLLPFFAIITVIYAWLKSGNAKPHPNLYETGRCIFRYTYLAFLVGTIAIIFVVLPVYSFHTLNYPPEKQLFDTQFHLGPDIEPLEQICVYLSDKPILRSLGHYMLGILMAGQRTVGGNTVYFMEMVSANGWWFYFPVIFALKTPLAFLILILTALLSSAYAIKPLFWTKPWQRTKQWIASHFTEFSMLVFLLIYWSFSMHGNLNIGIRHILPCFPFIYILVCLGLTHWLNSLDCEAITASKASGSLKKLPFKKMATSFVFALFGFYIISSLTAYPYYLSYFNELAGGTNNGYKYAVDSNYDWGQDLKRLKEWTEQANIEKIYIDYFGGSNLDYYFKEKYVRWDSRSPGKDFPERNYLAVSIGALQGGRAVPVPGFDQPTDYYEWLDAYEPIARAGKSIFIYYIP